MLKADAGTLAAAISRVLPVIERRKTIPILSNARLRVEAGVLTVSATNLDVQIDAEATVEGIAPSTETTINPRRLLAILRLLGKREGVELAVETGRAFLTWNGGRAALPTIPARDFPDMAMDARKLPDAPLGGDVREALARCFPFISREETRYYLNGVCLWPDKDSSFLVATDGHRLCSMPSGEGLHALAMAVEGHAPIIPRDTVGIWLDIAAGTDLTLRMQANAAKAEWSGEGIRFRSKLIDGSFPPWQRVIPKREECLKLTLDRPAFMRAATVIAAAAPRPYSSDGFIIVENGRAQLQAHNNSLEGVAVDLGPVDGPTVEVAVEPNKLLQALRATRGSSLTLWIEPRGPILFVGSDAQIGEQVVLMALRSATRPSFSAPPMAEAA
jgi:DNA polymerase-3 subunit beta